MLTGARRERLRECGRRKKSYMEIQRRGRWKEKNGEKEQIHKLEERLDEEWE